MKTLLLNDTSNYHNGCKQVVASFDFDNSIVTDRYHNAMNVNYKEYDKVILNGEGTMHHRSNVGLIFLNGLKKAQEAGCKTMLMNTVWQDMPKHPALEHCDRIVVREQYSHNALKQQGIDSEIAPDRSMLIPVEQKHYEYVEISMHKD